MHAIGGRAGAGGCTTSTSRRPRTPPTAPPAEGARRRPRPLRKPVTPGPAFRGRGSAPTAATAVPRPEAGSDRRAASGSVPAKPVAAHALPPSHPPGGGTAACHGRRDGGKRTSALKAALSYSLYTTPERF